MAATPRPRFRPAKQERSRRTLEAILAAARAMAAESGLESLTIQGVVERAGVSTGSFYARFAGREALIHHLENRYWGDAEDAMRHLLAPERWHGRDVAGLVRGVVAALVDTHVRQSRDLRAFLLHALAHPEEKPLRRVAALEDGVANRMVELIGDAQPAASPDAVRLATHQLLGVLRSMVLFGGHHPAGSAAGPDPSAELAALYLAGVGVREG